MPYKNPDKQREYQRIHQRKRGLIRKLAAIEKMGGKCEECGYSKNHSALQFDHKTPVRRKGGRHGENGRLSHSTVLKMDDPHSKFRLLCANCHAIVTYEQRTGNSNYLG